MSNWIDVEKELPPPETPVLALVHGLDYPIVLMRFWETCNPMIESYFEDFLYWDNPHNDGGEFDVCAWQSIDDEY